MTRAARYAYAGLALAFLVGLLVQVFLIGLGLFAGREGTEAHRTLGWILHLIPLLILGAAALSRAGRRHWRWALGLALVVFVVPVLPSMARDLPVVAALHPVGALVAFWLSTVVARNALDAMRQPDAATDGTASEAATA